MNSVKMTRAVMGMPITIEVVHDDSAAALRAMGGAFDWFRSVDRTFSTYKDDSEISRMNRGELPRAAASLTVREVLRACEQMRERTNGFFDMRRPDGLLDPSGYVKGWSIEQAAVRLAGAGMRNYCVEAGGDLQTAGVNADGGPWRVGVRNPLAPDEMVKVLYVSDAAVATSGTYERGEHIYDPHTGRPAAHLASVTVVGPGIAWVDVAATAAFAMGTGAAAWLAQQYGLEAYVIGHDGQATFTDGLKRYLGPKPDSL